VELRYYVTDDGFSVWAHESDAHKVMEVYVNRRQISTVLWNCMQRIVINIHVVYGTEVRVRT
jgi:hypothetical protein